MFQNLANYLLGSVIGTTTTEQQATTAEGVESSSIRLTAVENDDDWVVVDRARGSDDERDRDSEGNSEAESSADELDDRPRRVALTRTSSTSSLQHVSNMEESWFITPPPCFTSAGPIHMETSPLENLLIEHPSMSVYQHTHHRRFNMVVSIRQPTPSFQEEPLVVEELAEVDDDLEVENAAPVFGVVRAVRVNRQQMLQQEEVQRFRRRQAQKVQMKKAQQATSRTCLDRNNKAREANGRNRRQRRRERCQGAQRSHANNNRKC